MRSKIIKLFVFVVFFSMNLFFLWPKSLPEPYSGQKFGLSVDLESLNSTYHVQHRFYPEINEPPYSDHWTKSDLPPYAVRPEELSFLGNCYCYFSGSPWDYKGFDPYIYQQFEFHCRQDDVRYILYVEIRSNVDFDKVADYRLPDYNAKPMPEVVDFWDPPESQLPVDSTFQYQNICYDYHNGYLYCINWQYKDFLITVSLPLPPNSYIFSSSPIPGAIIEHSIGNKELTEELNRRLPHNSLQGYQSIPESGNEFIEKILDPEHAEEAVEMVNGAIDRSVRKNTLIRWTPVIIYVLAVLLIGGILVTLRLILRERRKKKAPPAEPEAAPDNIEKPEIKADPIPTNDEAPSGLLEDILKKE